ncbi:hypothetical protein ACQKPC_12695 [Pseudomonas sp. NPDC089918]|uniref:hypothetical protein n=1 Tax=Pseudomonas sp. NPDC089918 TaxID=3390654 RepID=UPI003CFFEDF6
MSRISSASYIYMREASVFALADKAWFCRKGRQPEQSDRLTHRHSSSPAIPRIVESDFSADIQFDSLVVDPALSVGIS